MESGAGLGFGAASRSEPEGAGGARGGVYGGGFGPASRQRPQGQEAREAASPYGQQLDSARERLASLGKRGWELAEKVKSWAAAAGAPSTSPQADAPILGSAPLTSNGPFGAAGNTASNTAPSVFSAPALTPFGTQGASPAPLAAPVNTLPVAFSALPGSLAVPTPRRLGGPGVADLGLARPLWPSGVGLLSGQPLLRPHSGSLVGMAPASNTGNAGRRLRAGGQQAARSQPNSGAESLRDDIIGPLDRVLEGYFGGVQSKIDELERNVRRRKAVAVQEEPKPVMRRLLATRFPLVQPDAWEPPPRGLSLAGLIAPDGDAPSVENFAASGPLPPLPPSAESRAKLLDLFGGPGGAKGSGPAGLVIADAVANSPFFPPPARSQPPKPSVVAAAKLLLAPMGAATGRGSSLAPDADTEGTLAFLAAPRSSAVTSPFGSIAAKVVGGDDADAASGEGIGDKKPGPFRSTFAAEPAERSSGASLFGAGADEPGSSPFKGGLSFGSSSSSTSLFGQSKAGAGTGLSSATAGKSIFGGTDGSDDSASNSLFGSSKAPASDSLFTASGSGGSSIFSSPESSGSSIFGAKSNSGSASIFGSASSSSAVDAPSSSGGSIFGAPSSNSSTSIFGAPTSSGSSATTSIFGAPPSSSGGSAASIFGAPPSSGDGSATSIFAAPAPSAGSGASSIFGAPSSSSGSGASSIFGSAEPKVFGTSAPSDSIFLFGASGGTEGAKEEPKSSIFSAPSSAAGLFSATESQGKRKTEVDQPALAPEGDDGDIFASRGKADPNVLAKRKIVRARRSRGTSDGPPARGSVSTMLGDAPALDVAKEVSEPTDAPQVNPFAGVTKKEEPPAVAATAVTSEAPPTSAAAPEKSAEEGEGDEAAPVKVETKEDFWRVQVEAVYRKRNPHKLKEVATLLEKYKGKEVALYAKICLRYDLNPKKLYADPKAWEDEDKDVKDDGEDEAPAPPPGGFAPSLPAGGLFGSLGSGTGGIFGALKPASDASSGSGGLFGSLLGGSTGAASGSIFGSLSSSSSSSAGNTSSVSGMASTSGIGSIFGGSSAGNSSSSIFGGSSKEPTGGIGSIFGGSSFASGGSAGSGIFGADTKKSETSGSPPTGLFALGSSSTTSAAGTSGSSSIFGASSGSSLFGGASSLFSDKAGASGGSSLFGGAPGGVVAADAKSNTSAASGNSAGAAFSFGGSSAFGGSAGSTGSTGSSVFGSPPAPPSGSSIFGGLASGTTAASNASIFGAPPASSAPSAGSIFGGAGSSIFGAPATGASDAGAGSAASIFGAPAGSGSTSSIFGGAPASTGSGGPFGFGAPPGSGSGASIFGAPAGSSGGSSNPFGFGAPPAGSGGGSSFFSFGAPPPPAAGAPGLGSLFGSAPTASLSAADGGGGGGSSKKRRASE